jgi:hypothetical protein
MVQMTKMFIAILVCDAVSIIFAAVLLMRSFWQPATAIAVVLFVANALIVPRALRVQRPGDHLLEKGHSKLWVLGFALLAAAFVRLVILLGQGFSWPGLTSVIAGLLVGLLFLSIARKSKGAVR